MKVTIYQIKDIENCDYAFAGWGYANRHSFDLNDYKKVYSDFYNETPDLEEIFYIFNMDIPENFKGHSLSVSDIVEVDGTKYYVDTFGFKVVA